MVKFILIIAALAAAGCGGIPSGVEPVSGFELERYLGTWYEIARLDHRFERGLIRVTAKYTLREDGGIDVLNRGYNPEEDRWRESRGRAYPAGEPGEGRLRVSFFRPFYAAYNIIALDRKGYAWALVCGPRRSYLWILARKPELAEEVTSRLVEKARARGFPVEELIFVEH